MHILCIYVNVKNINREDWKPEFIHQAAEAYY